MLIDTQSCWIRWGLLGSAIVIAFASVSVVLATVTVTITDEVYGNNNTGRTNAAALNDQWITDTKTNYPCFYQLKSIITDTGEFTYTSSGAGNNEITGVLGSSGLTISNRNMTNFSNISDTGELGGSVSIGTSLDKSLQDSAPMPDPQPGSPYGTDGWYKVSDGSSWEYWTESSGSNSNRNAVLFEFDPPTPAFGAFFGDLETRTDISGTAAVLRYKITGGSVVTQVIDTSTSSQDLCGNDFNGCGEQATRWLGIRGSEETFDWVLVIVGDDDETGDTDGNREHISWVGATVAEAKQSGSCPTPSGGPDPTAVTLSALSTRTNSPALLGASVLLLGTVIVWRRKRA